MLAHLTAIGSPTLISKHFSIIGLSLWYDVIYALVEFKKVMFA
jgi:hypothetical protein